MKLLVVGSDKKNAFTVLIRVAPATLVTGLLSPRTAAATQRPLTTHIHNRRTTRTSNRRSNTTTTMVSAITHVNANTNVL